MPMRWTRQSRVVERRDEVELMRSVEERRRVAGGSQAESGVAVRSRCTLSALERGERVGRSERRLAGGTAVTTGRATLECLAENEYWQIMQAYGC